MSRYTLTSDQLFVVQPDSPLAKWAENRTPMAYMRGPYAHGNDVMRVRKEDRPHGWMMHDVTAHSSAKAPGEIPLVPECTGIDGVPDWAIAAIVRGMLSSAEPTSGRARIIIEAAQRHANEFRS